MNQGSDRNRLLHSLPYGSSRRDVTVYVSYDEGGTWPASKCIVPYSSAYSSLCILPDGSIGLYVEEEYPGEAGYSMVFYNFSLEWLTDGDDIFVPVSVAEHPVSMPAQEIRYRVVEGRICIEEPELRSVAVYNVKGQLLKSLTVNGASEVLVDQLRPGIYVIEAQRVDGSKKYGKIILGS